MMKKYCVLLAFVLFAIISCEKEELPADLMVMGSLAANPNLLFTSTTLSGANEVPSNTSTASGTAAGTYNKTTKIIDLTVTYKDVTPSNWHIHKAAVGASGGVIFGFPTTEFKTPFVYKSPAALTDAQEADLLAGLYYVNIHSAKVPAGEIRGQIPVAASKGAGTIEGSFNPNTKILTVKINYSDITPTAWHIHKGGVNDNGPVVFDIGTAFNSGFTYTSAALSAEQETDLKAGNMYVNIHTTRAPGGEIRGQILAH
ncbi:CHRD domain-containing protein [Lacihabitans sp. CCS-44]|uniref:CHRD domain-containing protein n=1 Tax=Lacihabitans sp. CCS-44 TaxID=2487331 RepID=UPI0020CC12AA|nr:CHRD domain-containing protein [Lacihabitans sp. CCS-44]MCP9756287.1 CHRD domain-containing protein [Lacihabitans sp. CCS-44]